MTRTKKTFICKWQSKEQDPPGVHSLERGLKQIIRGSPNVRRVSDVRKMRASVFPTNILFFFFFIKTSQEQNALIEMMSSLWLLVNYSKGAVRWAWGFTTDATELIPARTDSVREKEEKSECRFHLCVRRGPEGQGMVQPLSSLRTTGTNLVLILQQQPQKQERNAEEASLPVWLSIYQA